MRTILIGVLVLIVFIAGCVSSSTSEKASSSPSIPQSSLSTTTPLSPTSSSSIPKELDIHISLLEVLGPFLMNVSGRAVAFEVLDLKVPMNVSGRITLLYNTSSVLTDAPSLLRPGDNVFTVYYGPTESVKWKLSVYINGTFLKTLTVVLKKDPKELPSPYLVNYTYSSDLYTLDVSPGKSSFLYPAEYMKELLQKNGAILLRFKENSSEIETLNVSSNVSIVPLPTLVIAVTKEIPLKELISNIRNAMKRKLPPWEVKELRGSVYEVSLPPYPLGRVEILDQTALTSAYALRLHPDAKYLIYIVKTAVGMDTASMVMGVLLVSLRHVNPLKELNEALNSGKIWIHYPSYAFALRSVNESTNFLLFTTGSIREVTNCALLGKAGMDVYQFSIRERAKIVVYVPNVPKVLLNKLRPFLMPYPVLPVLGEPRGTLLIFQELAAQPVGTL